MASVKWKNPGTSASWSQGPWTGLPANESYAGQVAADQDAVTLGGTLLPYTVTDNVATLSIASLTFTATLLSATTTLLMTAGDVVTVAGNVSLVSGAIIDGAGTLSVGGTIQGAGTIQAGTAKSGGTLVLTGTGGLSTGTNAPLLRIGTFLPTTLETDFAGNVTARPISITNANQTLEVAGGTLTISGIQNVTSGTLQMAGGTLADSSGVTLGQSVANGRLIGFGTVNANLFQSGSGTADAVIAMGGMLDLKGQVASGVVLAIDSAAPADLKIDGTATASTPVAISSANQKLEVGATGALTIGQAENISAGTIQLDGGKLTDTAGISVGSAATLIGFGTVSGALSGAGAVRVSGGTLNLTSNVLSTSTTFQIDPVAGSVLRLSGTAATGTKFTFAGSVGALELSDVVSGIVQQFNGTVVGLNVGASATVPTNEVNIQTTVTKATLAGSTITVANGATTVASLHLSAVPTTGAYAVVRSDSVLGGYDVFLSNAPPTVTWSPATEIGVEGASIALGAIVPASANTLSSVMVSGIAVGASLSDGAHSFVASSGNTSANILGWNYSKLSVTPAGDLNMPLSVQVTDSSGNLSTNATETVTVDPLAPTVVPVAASGAAGQPIALNLGITVNGLSGDSNSISLVTVSGIPAGATLSNTNGDALVISNGSITFSASQFAAGVLNGLAITSALPGAYTLNVAATGQDSEGNLSATAISTESVSAGGRTISTSIAGPLLLSNPPVDSPLVITSTGAVNSTGAGVDGIDGTTITTWIITNDGTVASAAGRGISLAGGGIVSNGPTSGSAASISGSIDGIAIYGAGTVTNWGHVSGNEAIRLNAGGSVSNASTGSISASGTVGGGFAIGAGVYIAHASGTVTNNGSISGGAYGVAMAIGGSVTNTASIIGGEDGVVFNGGSGTVTNSGQIIATVDDGVGMFTGGSVTNAAGALIQGAGTLAAGVFITGGVGSVSNSGRITTTGGKFGVLLTGSGGSVSNAASASIDGYTAGVLINGQTGTVTNAGSITATGAAGVDLEAGGSVGNQAGGTISGSVFGVFITGGAGTVTNSGGIASGKYAAVNLAAGGSVTNNAGGSVAGGTSGVEVQGGGAVSNAGTIRATAALSAGVYLTLGGSVSNATGALLGTGFGVFATGAAATVTNSGSISGPNGVGLQQGGSLTNNAGGVILGTSAGVASHGAPVALSNAGAISATAAGGAALDIEAGGSITNNAGGSITGASFGVFLAGGSGTVTNVGSIAGTYNIGVDLSSGGSVSNAAGAAISAAGFGVALYGSGGIVTNAGTISGSVSSVHFGSATSNNRLVVDPGAVFNGKVDAGGSGNTLELAQGASSGSIGGIGSSFTGFGTVAVDGGANWTLTGSNTAGTVLNNGTLAIAGGGSLTITTAVDPASAGLFVLNTSSLLEVAADTGSGNQMSFLGASEAIIDTASLFGTNVGQSTYTGPLLENFGAGDGIDLKDVSFAAITLDYTGATGLLQVASGGSGAATLAFQNASLGAGAFHAADDGSGHTLITLA